MVVSVKVKTNTEFLKTRLKKIERKIKSIIEKGILQGGFQLLDIIRTKTAKGIDFRDRPDRKSVVKGKSVEHGGRSKRKKE